MEAGRRCLIFSQNDMARRYFENALKRNQGSVEVLARLTHIHLRHNRLQEATELAERALHLDNTFGPVRLYRATLHRLAGELPAAENLLRAFLSQPHDDLWTQTLAWYELGTVLDSQKRYDDAMAAFLQAKTSIQPLAVRNGAYLEKVCQEWRETARTISAHQLRQWHETGAAFQPRHRFALLCGHPRSGTTLLEQVLDSHPAIVSTEETIIFSDEALIPLADGKPIDSVPLLSLAESASTERLQQSRANYFRTTERFLGQPVGNRLLVDKNPALTPAIPAVLRIFPEARFLVALRDPRDVCISCFVQPLMPSLPTSTVFQSLEATAAEYAAVMGLWQALKPVMPAPVLEVRYEDLVQDVESVARRTLEFLEVEWNDRVLEFQKHTQNKLVRSPTYADVRKPVTKKAVGRWQNYQKYLEPCLPVLEPFAKAFGYE